MPTVYTPNTVRVCMKFNSNGEEACNVYHVDLGEEPEVATMTTVAEIFKQFWLDDLQAVTQSGTSLQSIEVVDVSNAGDDGIIYTTGLPAVGTSSGNPLPNNVTVATKLTSGLTGRSRRGRKYFVGLSDNNISAGSQHVLSAMQTVLNTAYNALIDLLVAEGWALVVNSIISGGVPRTTGLNTPITNAVTNNELDSMRRRLPGRGV